MKVYKRTISLDSIVSHLPGAIPSLVNTWTIPKVQVGCNNETDEIKFYNYSDAFDECMRRNINPSKIISGTEFADTLSIQDYNVFEGNYGLIVSDVVIPDGIAEKVTDYTDIYVNIPNEEGGYYNLSWPDKSSNTYYYYEGRKIMKHSNNTDKEVKVLTYQTLNKWYSFFEKYNSLLCSEPPILYNTAVDYYEKEINADSDSIRSEYEEMDRIFESRGGKEMYDWICQNCIIKFTIPNEYVENWGTRTIFYSDALRWVMWFEERNPKYQDLSSCTESDDCCDCEEYVKRGGFEFYSILKEWCEGVNFNSNATFSASYPITLNFDVSIDDLGEMSILSEDWQEGVDYSNQTIDKNAGLGTVVNQPYIIDDETFEATILNDTFINNGMDKGYYYDTNYFESRYDESAWQSYTDYYVSNHEDEINPVVENGIFVTSYAFHPITNKVVYNPLMDEINKMGVKYNIVGKNVFLINDRIYDIQNGEYVENCYDGNGVISNHKLYPVKRVSDTISYVDINNRRYYSDFNDENKEVFYFSRLNNCVKEMDDDFGCEVEGPSDYVIFQDSIHLVNDGKVEIYQELRDSNMTTSYMMFDGYIEIDNNLFFIKDNSIVVKSETGDTIINDDVDDMYIEQSFEPIGELEMHNLGWKYYQIDNGVVTIVYEYDIFDCTKVTGYTDSKIGTLIDSTPVVDEMNNELPGSFTIKMYADIENSSENSHYIKPYDGCRLDFLYHVGSVSGLEKNDELPEDRFYGNILTKMDLFYVNEFGEKESIEWETLDDIEEAINEYIDIYFDITYYIGAVIHRIENASDKSVRFEMDTNYLNGVKYTDTVKVTDEVADYYMADGTSFLVKYFNLLSDFENNGLYAYPRTRFEMSLSSVKMISVSENGNISCNGGAVEFEMVDGKNVRDYIAAPVFRQDFNLASSYYQNIEANIYIDRGIASAIDKHLKLQEIRTLEAMENAGNGSTFTLTEV